MRRFSYIFLFLSVLAQAMLAQTDSLGIERKGEQVFVIHKVQPQQTLYSLSRRYKTSVSQINAANPILVNGLQIGQTLKIPYGGDVISPDSAVISTTEDVSHTVKAGETLFSIARKYNVQVSAIKSWNNLPSNSIDLNQKLVIKKEVLVPVNKESQVEEKAQTSPPSGLNTQDSVLISKEPFEKEEEVKLPVANSDTSDMEVLEETSYPGTPFRQVETEGVAEVIDEDEPSSKFFALHKTAKVGTVIKVKNLMNDLTVYVRVIGSIPETSGNESVIIKLNQRAYDHLKAIDKRFRVQLNYFQ